MTVLLYVLDGVVHGEPMTVMVYIWETRADLFKAGLDNFDIRDHGHVSAQVYSGYYEYMSFWPSDDAGDRPRKLKLSSREAYYTESYEEDCSEDAMNRQADRIIDIYSLDEPAMISYWNKVKVSHFHFMKMNCSTVVGHMLLEGLRWYSLRDSVVQQMRLAEEAYWEPSDTLKLALTIRELIG